MAGSRRSLTPPTCRMPGCSWGHWGWEGAPMTFDDVLAQVLEILRQQGRVSYAALKRRFALDDAYLDDLKTELIDAQRLAQDEAGRVLVWRTALDAPPERSRTPRAVPDAQPIRQDRPPASPQSMEAERRQLTV